MTNRDMWNRLDALELNYFSSLASSTNGWNDIIEDLNGAYVQSFVKTTTTTEKLQESMINYVAKTTLDKICDAVEQQVSRRT